MTTTTCSPTHLNLHIAALDGSAERIRQAIASGADLNSLDSQGRTVLACIIHGIPLPPPDASNEFFFAQERVEGLRVLLSHRNISLYTLNASDPQGATPLGAAAGMNLHGIVQALLSDSAGAVSVDGIDSRGATALMHACFAGNVQVVRTLLRHGARPDFRDSTGSTAIQRGIHKPDILWMCELALRRHRWRRHSAPTRPSIIWDDVLSKVALSIPSSHELSAPAIAAFSEEATQALAAKLSDDVSKVDIDALHASLFPASSSDQMQRSPVLVNQLDARGWGLLHYCTTAEEPSLDVLMALYLAGADLSLPTSFERYTPLHCLARAKRSPSSEALHKLLGFVVHLVRDLNAPLTVQDRNEETPIHAAAEHGSCLEVLAFLLELDKTGLAREIRNARGLTALEVAKPEFRVAFGMEVEQLRSLSSLSILTIKPLASRVPETQCARDKPSPQPINISAFDADIQSSSQQLVENLTYSASISDRDTAAGELSSHTENIKETKGLLDTVLEHHKTNVSIARQELDHLLSTCASVEEILDKVNCSVDAELCRRGLRSINFLNRGSEDSQLTAVTFDSSPLSFRSRVTSAPSPSPFKGPTSRRSEPYLRARANTTGSKYSLNKSAAEKKSAQTLSLKFTNWFKRKMMPSKFLEVPEKVLDDDESFECEDCDSDETGTLNEDAYYADEPVDNALQTSCMVLNTARRDLSWIRSCIDETSTLLNKCDDSILKVERLSQQVLQKCSFKIHQMHIQQLDEELSSFYDIFTSPPKDLAPPGTLRPTLSACPSMASISSASSMHVTEAPEIKSIRRILGRRLGARMDSVQNNLRTRRQWLAIVQEAVRDVKSRTYVSL